MNGDVTVRDVMAREYVGASEGDTLQDTAALMLEEDVEAVVVLRGQEPVGLLTQRDVLAAAVQEGALDGLTVSDAMQSDLQTVDPDESLASATDLISGSDIRRLLVTEGGETLGIISEHDVVTASTLSPGTNGGERPERDSDAVVTEVAVEGAETMTGDEEYSNQGICEVCGSLTGNLSSFNGQLVCADCKDV
jgi:CBS domain-containing protein